jgi:hypothetical protein
MLAMAGPVVLLGFHRGGTTFAQRLLNAHRDLTVWGENGGLLTHLRKAHQAFSRNAHRFDAAAYTEGALAAAFEPWANPLDGDDLLRALALFLERTYGVAGTSVWGFKEIRHRSFADLEFFRKLFPDGRLVLELRHPVDLLMSELHTAWTVAQVVPLDEFVPRFARRYVAAVGAFTLAAARWPAHVRIVTYEGLRDDVGALARTVSWLGLDVDRLDLEVVDVVRAAKVGSSFGDAGRAVAEADVTAARRSFDSALAAALARPAAKRAAQTLSAHYGSVGLAVS